jgi:hypothetical protein
MKLFSTGWRWLMRRHAPKNLRRFPAGSTTGDEQVRRSQRHHDSI